MLYFECCFLFAFIPYSNSLSSQVFLGDGQTVHINNSACDLCVGLRPRFHYPKTTQLPITTTHIPAAATTSVRDVTDNIDPPAMLPSAFPSVDYVSGTFEPSPESVRVRRAESTSAALPVPTLVLPHVPIPSMSPPPPPPSPHTTVGPVTQLDTVVTHFSVYDGQLDTSSNYTGFVELIGEVTVYCLQ